MSCGGVRGDAGGAIWGRAGAIVVSIGRRWGGRLWRWVRGGSAPRSPSGLGAMVPVDHLGWDMRASTLSARSHQTFRPFGVAVVLVEHIAMIHERW